MRSILSVIISIFFCQNIWYVRRDWIQVRSTWNKVFNQQQNRAVQSVHIDVFVIRNSYTSQKYRVAKFSTDGKFPGIYDLPFIFPLFSHIKRSKLAGKNWKISQISSSVFAYDPIQDLGSRIQDSKKNIALKIFQFWMSTDTMRSRSEKWKWLIIFI